MNVEAVHVPRHQTAHVHSHLHWTGQALLRKQDAPRHNAGDPVHNCGCCWHVYLLSHKPSQADLPQGSSVSCAPHFVHHVGTSAKHDTTQTGTPVVGIGAVALALIALLLATRHHYTADVLIAIYICTFAFLALRVK
jgi:hypothetical protein